MPCKTIIHVDDWVKIIVYYGSPWFDKLHEKEDDTAPEEGSPVLSVCTVEVNCSKIVLFFLRERACALWLLSFYFCSAF